MIVTYVAVAQCCLFFIFATLEWRFPARHLQQTQGFWRWWIFVVGFGSLWLKLLVLLWASVPTGVVSLPENTVAAGIVYYLFYSLCNYWWHRYKHMNPFLWRWLHRVHHSPQKMQTAVCYFKHPLEFIVNSAVIWATASVFGASYEVVAIALLIEGGLETYHHSNIKTPDRLRWLGYIIQTPEMHLVHHERGLHKHNYVAAIWDTVFGTVYIPDTWQGRQGLKNARFLPYFVLRD